MLGDKRVMTTIPVRDVDRARGFYEGVLGLRFAGGPRADGSFEYECGAGTGLYTYPTEENAGQSPATLAAWRVEDIHATAKALRDKHIVLEEYDTPELKTEDGIAALPGGRTIWFKDPDGNILNAFERD
ncbi:MAG: VOC family protein [Actinomycetota bacterium]|nr:VOC family protein [Actinomycetota bacterium]